MQTDSKTILITGGAWYIGSHTAVLLLEAGCDVIIVDNLSNSSLAAIEAIKSISGKEVPFHRIDLRDMLALRHIFAGANVSAVIHFAALKSVAESVSDPLGYYDNNVGGTISLLRAMSEAGVKKMVYSSSATVYGTPEEMPLKESDPINSATAASPYGRSKIICEEILQDLCAADSGFAVAALRYFNPIGAHSSGKLGEAPLGQPNNIMPNIIRAAKGEVEALKLFGVDYDTPDGSCIRDYVHILDLAAGHLAALRYIQKKDGFAPFNLGTGKGTSVLELIAAFEAATGVKVPRENAPRRPGDIAVSYADTSKAHSVLGFTAKRDIAEMCRDAWRVI